MKPALKKAVIFGLAAGLGPIIRDQLKDQEKKAKYFADLSPAEMELLIWNADQIESAGVMALDKCHVKKDRSLIRQAERKIREATGTIGEIDFLKMLSFLFLGLAELEHYCKDKAPIQAVKDAALNFITVFDPNFEDDLTHAEALKDFERWTA